MQQISPIPYMINVIYITFFLSLSSFVVEDTPNLPPSPPPSPAAEHIGPQEQGRPRNCVYENHLMDKTVVPSFLMGVASVILSLPTHWGAEVAWLWGYSQVRGPVPPPLDNQPRVTPQDT